jgi:hypothetical protein
VRGSHGRVTDDPQHGPLFITGTKGMLERDQVAATEVRDLLLRHVFD